MLALSRLQIANSPCATLTGRRDSNGPAGTACRATCNVSSCSAAIVSTRQQHAPAAAAGVLQPAASAQAAVLQSVQRSRSRSRSRNVVAIVMLLATERKHHSSSSAHVAPPRHAAPQQLHSAPQQQHCRRCRSKSLPLPPATVTHLPHLTHSTHTQQQHQRKHCNSNS